MKAFYKAMITKQAIGSAILHKEPPLEGKVVTKVTDTTTAGDSKLIIIECDETQHAANLTLPGVVAVSEDEAMKLAPKYQPKRKMRELVRRLGQEEEREVPALDLKALLKAREAGAPSAAAPPKKKVAGTTRPLPRPSVR